MTTYAIGDVQGCFQQLNELLAHIQFDSSTDSLWFTGDLVNRGPHSLEVLRFVKSLGEKQKTVLGNHDLHLLALHYGVGRVHKTDTLDSILSAPDREELMDWLRRCPLLHQDDFIMVHAGLAPGWTIEKAKSLASEVETVLQSEAILSFLTHMYGNQPDQWHDELQGFERLRCITNYFTRMRFCHQDGRLDLTYKGEMAHKPANLIPWFDVEPRENVKDKIIFGHWAALGGYSDKPNIYPLDTGCVWGNCLTAMRLSDGRRFSVKCG